MAHQFGEESITKMWRNIPIKKYIETADILDKNDSFYYIELEDEFLDTPKSYKFRPKSEQKDNLDEVLAEVTA